MKWLDTFHLTETERKGFFVLIALFLLVLIIRIALLFIPAKEPSKVQLQNEFAAWQAKRVAAMQVATAFDPNSVADSVIQSFKISPFAIKNWIAFRESGRQFTRAEDVLAIYGMDTVWFQVNRDSIRIEKSDQRTEKSTYASFKFNPNTVTVKEMMALGFSQSLAQRIEKYRAKGGLFRSAEDLKKIYGFPDDVFKRVEPLVTLPPTPQQQAKPAAAASVLVELNSCDSITLLTVKGIGPVFAQRILKERSRLGGFYQAEQLLSIYGITQERLDAFKSQLTINGEEIKRLNINEATFNALLAHPYLSYQQVQQIVSFRETMRPFNSVDELVQLPHFTASDVNRLKYYLQVE